MGSILFLCVKSIVLLNVVFIFNLQKGELYLLTIELRDPNIRAIEFVLKDGSRDRWFGFFLSLTL